MDYCLKKQDINTEPYMAEPPRFNHKDLVMKTEQVYKCEIINIVELTEYEKLFHLKIMRGNERQLFSFRPGQFVMLEVPGFGEVPISISSSSNNLEYIELCIRRAGRATNMLHRAKIGSKVGIRGPFGTSFPMEKMRGHDILLIAGGLGLAPLRAPIYWVSEHRDDFEDVHVLYGTKDPSQLLFDYQYDAWQRVNHLNLMTIVETADEGWTGKTGMITELFKDIEIKPNKTFAIVCGPPVMFKFVCTHLDGLGMPMNRMFVSLERRMHCGMGKCCRCMVGSTFTCVDGPVFNYWSVLNLQEAI